MPCSRLVRTRVLRPCHCGVNDRDRDKFHKAIPGYLRELAEYYQILNAVKTTWSRLIEIKLVVHNIGSVPADVVDLTLFFPPQFQVLEEEELPKAPVEPKRPELTSSSFAAFYSA